MKKKESGIALIAAIFLVVVIGAAFIVLASLTVRNTQQSTQNLLKARAQLAANAGLEATVQRIILNPTATGWCNNTATTVNVAAYSNFTVQVNCDRSDYNRPSQQIALYTLTATAEYGSSNDNDYVWTEISATIEL
jgi:type II secretory pathway component PulK